LRHKKKPGEERVLQALAASDRGPLKAKEIARTLGIPTHDYRGFKRLLTGLEKAGKIFRVKGHRYAVSASLELCAGVISLTRAGDGFLRPDSGVADVFVPANQLDTAMDGDRVVVRIEARPRGRSPVGRVIKVLERSRETLVGTLHRRKRLNFVVPLDSSMRKDVLIPHGSAADAEDGDVVVVRVESYGEGRVGPVGVVEKVLGPISDPGVDVLAVAHGFGLALDFPVEVSKAAEDAALAGMADPGSDRVDRTGLLVFSIDPADAKDHDDALSVEPLGPDRFEVGVHIADVAHFVREAGAVDIEALARGTSVYLVDRTVPMLPEALSADVCSLRAGVDRFAVSLFLEMDRQGSVHGRRYERTRIRSAHGLAYEEVQAVLDGNARIDEAVDSAIRTLDDLARHLRVKRSERGALDLDVPEAKVVLDDQGQPIDILRRPRLNAHRLVEDFMILANEVVAGDLEAQDVGTLYRVHEPPARERADELRELLGRIGHRLPGRKALKPRDLQHLLNQVQGRPEQALVSRVVLRSLAKARYDPRNLGHFGLASTAYLHFTSPIRRYPDLVVHREVTRTLVLGDGLREWDGDVLRSIAERTSARERAADAAERASIDLKKVEFMERHLGEDFEGQISGVVSFGLFVTLDRYFVDGLVHVSGLDDDFYRLDQATYALVGERGHRRYQLGDRVSVQVARVDKEARHIDFVLLRKLTPPN
jgi:ribonuclease R